jgi:hypothetical protein
MILIRPPGQPLALIEKRAGDDRYCNLDCKLLLQQFELLASVQAVQGDAVDFSKTRVGAGNTIQLFLKALDYTASTPFIDTPVSVTCVTSQGTIQASALVRTHKF